MAVLLVGLSGFSVVEIMILKNQVTAQTAQIAVREAQITELKSEIEAKDAQISELEKENAKLQKEVNDLKELSKTAKIEITFRPNPVPYIKGSWHWRVIVTEVNGVGVYLDSLTYERCKKRGPTHMGGEQVDVSRIVSDRSWIAEKWLGYPSAYLPFYCSADFGAGTNGKWDYALFTITGIDDNGHEIRATGRVDLLPP